LLTWINLNAIPAIVLLPHSNTRLTELPKYHSIRIAVGPEGGFSDAEVNELLQNKEFSAISLGPRILRTETAGLTTISILQSLFGDI